MLSEHGQTNQSELVIYDPRDGHLLEAVLDGGPHDVGPLAFERGAALTELDQEANHGGLRVRFRVPEAPHAQEARVIKGVRVFPARTHADTLGVGRGR